MEIHNINEVEVTHVGLLELVACAPDSMQVGDVATAVNILHPTGVSSQWQSPEERTDAKPIPCAHHAGRMHHYFIC